ncbi:MAG: DMT family transporter [Thermomicrobiales bacterium]
MGELTALASALVWTVTNIVLRGQSAKFGAVAVNAWRTLFAALCFAVIFIFTRNLDHLTSIPLTALAALLGAVVLGMVIGDALQFTAMIRIGVARAMPVSSCFPLFTMLVAAVILGEQITPRSIGGAVLVIAGVIIVALPRRGAVEGANEQRAAASRYYWVGVGMALTAAICWSFSTTLIRVGVRDIDVITANTIRLPFSASVSFLIGARQGTISPRRFDARSWLVLLFAGLVGSAAGGYLYLTAVSLAGAGKTAVITGASPIFGMVAAIIFLGERPGPRGFAGALLAFAGIILVV